jgi:tRNA threonylcarbamoyladenosine biosynthesis protein TsaE
LNDFVTNSPEDTREAGRQLGAVLRAGDVVALSGPLGAGKTTFTQGVAEALGVTEKVTSPTYTLINEYDGKLPLYHMDLYRLSSPEEFAWLGVEELIEGAGVSLVEWSERAGEELPDRTIRVNIALAGTGTRVISIRRSGAAA